MSKEPEDTRDEAEEDQPAEAEETTSSADEDADEASSEGDEEPKPAAKPADRKARTGSKRKTGKKSTRRKTGKSKATPRMRKGRPVKKKGSPARSIFIYILLIGGIAFAFAMLGQQEANTSGPAPPKWKDGEVADVSITLVTTDVKDLACASEAELKGLHCAYQDKRKPHQKGNDARKSDKILQPYTTTNQLQFLAAGMWQQPEIKAMLDKEDWDNPSPRFTVNCKFTVSGKMSEANIRWKPEHGWLAGDAADWYAGSLSECKIRKSARAKKPLPKTKLRPKPAPKKE